MQLISICDEGNCTGVKMFDIDGLVFPESGIFLMVILFSHLTVFVLKSNCLTFLTGIHGFLVAALSILTMTYSASFFYILINQ